MAQFWSPNRTLQWYLLFRLSPGLTMSFLSWDSSVRLTYFVYFSPSIPFIFYIFFLALVFVAFFYQCTHQFSTSKPVLLFHFQSLRLTCRRVQLQHFLWWEVSRWLLLVLLIGWWLSKYAKLKTVHFSAISYSSASTLSGFFNITEMSKSEK